MNRSCGFCYPHRLQRHLVWLFIGLTLAISVQAAKFSHATLGTMDIYTSDSPASTQLFVCELMEVRRQVQDLVGARPLPNPRVQLVVFRNISDYREFLPKGTVKEDGMDTVSGFTHGESGLTMAVVREGDHGYKFGKDVILYFYAQHLILSVAPEAPLWILAGLPEFLAATECRRNNRIYLGGQFMEHQMKVRASKLIPLASLMNNGEMRKHFYAPKHDTVLYHESWALWHEWLTTTEGNRRAQIRQLFAALRAGEPGDFDTVAKSFGEPKEAIEKVHRTKSASTALKVIESNGDAASLVKGLEFRPATDLDAKFALAMLFARTGKGLGTLGLELIHLADRHPESPRPMEALAALAMGENDTETAAFRWEKARELNTENPFAYLNGARRGLVDRRFNLLLTPQLTDPFVDEKRQMLERCVQLDPGSFEANYYRVMVEAFAPQPRKQIVDSLEESQILSAEPIALLYLAIAQWRLGECEKSQRGLVDLQAQPGLSKNIHSNITFLLTTMKQKEAAANP